MRVRIKTPTWNAVKWDGKQDVPGLEREKTGRTVVRTVHRALYDVKPGVWLVYSDTGEHQAPCLTQEQFDRTYEKA